MRTSTLTSVLIAAVVGWAPVAGADTDPGYEPGAPLVCCSNNCFGGAHGTCNADCTLTCDTNYTNCDNDVTNGCECGGSNGCGVFNCVSATCESVPDPVKKGVPCSTDCLLNATCDPAGTGLCNGTPARDGQPCTSTGHCMQQAVCGNGVCTCPPPVDNMNSNTTGNSTGGCQIATSGTPAALAALLLLAGIALVLRRRRA